MMQEPSSPVSYPLSSSPVTAAALLPKRSLKRKFSSSLDQSISKRTLQEGNRTTPLQVCTQSPNARQRASALVQKSIFDSDSDSHSDSENVCPAPTNHEQKYPQRLPRENDAFPSINGNLSAPTRCSSLIRPAIDSNGKRYSVALKHFPGPSTQQVPHKQSRADQKFHSRELYGLDIHALILEARKLPEPGNFEPIPPPTVSSGDAEISHQRYHLWSEKYRAHRFTDLMGDDRTHRNVLRWVKRWDPVVFPSLNNKIKHSNSQSKLSESANFRKLLLLSGDPGSGKTTMAHVCARQAGYEVLEINASDDRSGQVVRNRIKDVVGTETVKGSSSGIASDKSRRTGRPSCIIVDEVDGVDARAGSTGESGFIKALLDLIALDQWSLSPEASVNGQQHATKRRKTKFRISRPIILICNDLYHPSLRLLRQSPHVESIVVRKPQTDRVAMRICRILGMEGIQCDLDGAQKLCELAWGCQNKAELLRMTEGGDVRSVLVLGELAASKLRNAKVAPQTLTRAWIEQWSRAGENSGLGSYFGSGHGSQRMANHVFGTSEALAKCLPLRNGSTASSNKVDGGVSQLVRRQAIAHLRDLVNASGDAQRVMADCFGTYLSNPFQDDMMLTKPNMASNWLHFHDCVASAVHRQNQWELGGYLSHSTLAFHHLFAGSHKAWHSGNAKEFIESEVQASLVQSPRAEYHAMEATKRNNASLDIVSNTLSTHLNRVFNSRTILLTEFFPHMKLILQPAVKVPLLQADASSSSWGTCYDSMKKSEQLQIDRAATVMASSNIRLSRSHVLGDGPDVVDHLVWDPPIDIFTVFETQSASLPPIKTNTQLRHILKLRAHNLAAKRQRADVSERATEREVSVRNHQPAKAGASPNVKGVVVSSALTRDFFGRLTEYESPIVLSRTSSYQVDSIFVSFHEGFSNAVRKPVTLTELIGAF